MKIRYYSDIHLEFSKFKIPEGDQDTVLVLAGDIGVGASALPWIERVGKDYRAIIYVAGNHEFYVRNRTVGKVLKKLKENSIPNLYFLENDKVTIDGVDFLGCTLWSDMNKECPAAMAYCKLRINDFKISNASSFRVGLSSKRRFTPLQPEHTVEFHRDSVAFLEREIANSTNPLVVVTHHSPTEKGLNRKRYNKSDLDYAYYSDLEWLMGKPDLWIFGHTHKYLDTNINGTRVLSNPRGYETHYEFTNYTHRSLQLDV